MPKKLAKSDKALANFVYEIGILSKTPRSYTWFLGTGNQSVAEHTLRSAFITYCLCKLTKGADAQKAVMMALVHDLAEGRTSDHNYVHQRYGRMPEHQAMSDIARSLPFGPEILSWFKEGDAKITLEAKLMKDADQLEFIASLREEEIKGNQKAKTWLPSAYKRLKTPAGKKLGKLLRDTNPDDWWFNPKDKWWVDRKKGEWQI